MLNVITHFTFKKKPHKYYFSSHFINEELEKLSNSFLAMELLADGKFEPSLF